jgi:hypothetical protein
MKGIPTDGCDLGLSIHHTFCCAYETGTLDVHAYRSDCFRDAAASIRDVCATGDPNEDERVQRVSSLIFVIKGAVC